MPPSDYEQKRIDWLAEHPGEPYPDDQDDAPQPEDAD